MSTDISLKAVVFADLVGYSRLVGENEDFTLAFVDRCFEMLREEVAALDGDLIRTTGDGFIVLFRSASTAVKFAIKFHRGVVRQANDDASKYQFRIGIHQGEVRREEIDVYGNAVNIAARLEALAEPGSTLVSGDIYREARRGVDVDERIATYQVIEAKSDRRSTFHDPLRLNVLDKLSALAPDGEVSMPSSGTIQGIVGSLALSSGHRETKATLATLFWPRSTPENARRSLARTTRQITTLFDSEVQSAIVSDAEQIWLDEQRVVVDLDQMLEDGRSGKIDDRLMKGIDWEDGLLPQLTGISPLLDSWVKVSRNHWRAEFSNALEECLDRFEPDHEGGRRAAVALLSMEPGHEPAARSLMRHHLSRGNRPAALKEFNRLRDHLKAEFDIEPDSETQKLVDDLKRGSEPTEPVKRVTAPRKLQLTIDEFEADGEGGDYRIFGFRIELIANLSKFREWFVVEGMQVSENSVTEIDGYTLRGNMRLFGERGFLQLQLLDSPTRRVVWGDNFQIELENWQVLQKQIVAKIAATLEIYISSDRLSQTMRRPSVDQTSFDSWLRGEQLLARWTPEGESEAKAIFERIVANDPNFAPAYASLASIHNVLHLISPGFVRDAEVDRAAFDLCQRAVEIDPMDARNHLSVAWTAAMAGSFDQAVIHLDLAVSLNASSPKTAISAAMGNAFYGKIGHAVELLDSAMEMTPMLSPEQWSYAAAIRYLADDFEGALYAAARSNDQIVDMQGWRAVALQQLGQTNEAGDAFTRLVAAVTPFWAGSEPAAPTQVHLWFRQAFPFRHEDTRAAVGEMLEKAMM